MSQILIPILNISIDTMEASKIIEILSDYNFWEILKKSFAEEEPQAYSSAILRGVQVSPALVGCI